MMKKEQVFVPVMTKGHGCIFHNSKSPFHTQILLLNISKPHPFLDRCRLVSHHFQTQMLGAWRRGGDDSAAAAAAAADDDDEYSFATEYTGPPVSFVIPKVVPLDVHRASTAGPASLRSSALPISSQPTTSPHLNSGSTSAHEYHQRRSDSSSFVADKNGSTSATESPDPFSERNGIRASSSDDTLESPDAQHHSNLSSELSDYRNENENRAQEHTGEVEEGPAIRGHRANAVTFRDLDQNEERPPVEDDGKRGMCLRCRKTSRFSESQREVCIVCRAKYCRGCVLRAMGCMPEGRKCVTCIGFPVDESRRGSLGKCSRMLRRLLTSEQVERIMNSERSCDLNQPPSHLVIVNDKPLSSQELVTLQNCSHPPKNLRTGRYWYDKVSGFWGKEGEKPCQIITAQLEVGYLIKQDASKGNTNVKINNREITKAELRMLQAAGIHCEGNPHFWVTPDGSYQHEGMNHVMGKLWEKRRVKLVCAALSLPYPSDGGNSGASEAGNNRNIVNINNQEEKELNKLLLFGGAQSGKSTIFKQARILYNLPFSDEEKQDLKTMIQRNLYRYIAILIDGREHFENEYTAGMRERRIHQPSTSENSNFVPEERAYAFSPRLEAFSKELLEIIISGSFEATFPAATREYSPVVEELWKDKSFQSIYNRRNELLPMLPGAASYFLERAVEISRVDYEPTETDILFAEGLSSSNGIASMKFSFPYSSEESYRESDENDSSTRYYHLIRARQSNLGADCKFLHLLEGMNLVIFCVSLSEYDEHCYDDKKGAFVNQMMETKKLFESIVTHPTLAETTFFLILNKFDLLEEKIKQVPLKQCDWFQDFCPVISNNSQTNRGSKSSAAQQAFHYIAVKFKRLFSSLTGRKLFISRVTGLDPGSVDNAFRLCKEVLKWESDKRQHPIPIHLTEWSTTESIDQSTSP